MLCFLLCLFLLVLSPADPRRQGRPRFLVCYHQIPSWLAFSHAALQWSIKHICTKTNSVSRQLFPASLPTFQEFHVKDSARFAKPADSHLSTITGVTWIKRPASPWRPYALQLVCIFTNPWIFPVLQFQNTIILFFVLAIVLCAWFNSFFSHFTVVVERGISHQN